MVFPVFILFTLFSTLFLIDKSEQRVKSIFAFLLFVWLALAFIAAFRPDEMADRENYLLFWNELGEERFEIGFTLLTEIIRCLNNDFYFYFFCCAALSIALKITAICRMTSLIWGALLIYVAYIFVLHDMIQMRCAIASGLLLHAVYYTVRRNFKKFFLIGCIAFLFHYSAILVFPLWFLNTTRPQKKIYITLILVAYVFSISGVYLTNLLQYVPIEGLLNIFLRSQGTIGDNADIFNAVQLCRLAICFFLFFRVEKIYARNKFSIVLMKIYAISLAILPLFADLQIVAYRVSQLYQVVEIVLIPMLLYSFQGMELIKRFCVIVIGLSFLLMTVFVFEHLK